MKAASRSAIDGVPPPSMPPMSRRSCLAGALAGLGAPWLSACGGASTSSRPPAVPVETVADSAAVQWARAQIQTALARPDSGTSAVSIALLVDDKVVWREAFGQADRQLGLAATPDMRLNVGSVAKVVATLAVMILRDRQLLALDQPLVELLPAFRMRSPEFTQVSVRHLLSHSAGFPGTNNRNLFGFVPIEGYAQDTLDALAQSRLKHAPGELAVYCNDGFTLVELLVRQLSGRPFTEFVQHEIFEPLGMLHSGYPTAFLPDASYVSPHHAGQRLTQEMPAAHATGGMYSTPNDMLQLARLLMNEGMFAGRQRVSASAVRDMAQDQGSFTRIHPAPESWTWGLGWDFVQQAGLAAAGLRAWEKGGDSYFFSSKFLVLPDARLALMVSGNGHDYGAGALAEGLLLRCAVARKSIAALPPSLEAQVPARATAPAQLDALLGVYANDAAPYRVLAEGDDALQLQRWSQQLGWTAVLPPLQLRLDGRWWADGQTRFGIYFHAEHGHRYLMWHGLSASNLYWQDVPMGEWLAPLMAPLPAAWQARLGSQWQCINEHPQSLVQLLGPTLGRIDALDALPGYLMWNHEQLLRPLDDAEAGMTVQLPGFGGRDQIELHVRTVGDVEQLSIGSMVFTRVAGCTPTQAAPASQPCPSFSEDAND